MGVLDFFGGGAGPKYQSNKAAFDRYAGEMDNQAKRYQGNVDMGNKARDMSFDQYQKLIDNPNFLQDQVSSGFSESPYQKEMMDRVMKRMNMNSANTGMMGSGSANRALQDELLKMTGQFQGEYTQRGMNSYNQGLDGLNRLTDLGFKSMGSQDNLNEQAAAGRLKGDMSENEAQQRNAEAQYAAKNRGIGNIMGLAGGIAGSMFGGPAGGSFGSTIGNYFGGSGGGGGFSPSNYSNGAYNTPAPQPNGGFNIGNWSF